MPPFASPLPRSILTRIAGVFALALLGSGCLVMPYESPTTGPVANLRINNLSSRFIMLNIYEDSLECRERHNLMPVIRSSETRDIKVSAGKEATLSLGQDVDVDIGYNSFTFVGCIGTFTFNPADGHSYELNFQQAAGVCRSTFKDITTSPAVPVEFQSRTWKTAFDEHGPFCDAR